MEHSQRLRLYWSIVLFGGLSAVTGCASVSTVASGRNDTANKLHLRAIDQKTKAEACRLTAEELAAHGKDNHAIAQFEQARQLDPEIRGIAHSLAVLYDRQGRRDAAHREYTRALEETPRDPDVHNDLGYFLYSQGQYSDAQRSLERALQLDGEHSKARINLAMVLAAEGNFDVAFRHFEQALGPAAAHHNIGLLQMRAGRRDEGIVHLRQAMDRDPSLGSVDVLVAFVPEVAHDSEILPASLSR